VKWKSRRVLDANQLVIIISDSLICCRFEDVTSPVPSDRMVPEVDVQRERRSQQYFTSMTALYAICLCPLMVLRSVIVLAN